MNLEKIKTEIENCQQATELENLRIKYLGRHGIINSEFAKIKTTPNPKEFGQYLNQLKQQIEDLISCKLESLPQIKNDQTKNDEPIFATKKAGSLHPITITERKLNALFRQLGFSVYDGPEVETDEYCFQRLNLPSDHPARDMQDSIYVREPDILLRTQTSSIEARLLAANKPPFRAAFPGKVYRNEKVNKSNHFIFHQYQAVVVDKNVTLKDLFGTMDLMFKTLYGPNVVTRYRLKYYPEVEPGVGPDMQCFNCHGAGCPICKGAGWMEMGGAGIIHPNVLKMANIDPNIWSGFAFGMGLDRWTMANFGITDIRTLTGGNLAYKPNEK